MSQTNIIYPQSTDRTAAWQVREDGDDYGKLSRKLLELHDLITDRLVRADALTYLMQTAENPQEHAPRITAMLLQDLIQDAQQANEKLWEEVHRLTCHLGDDATRH